MVGRVKKSSFCIPIELLLARLFVLACLFSTSGQMWNSKACRPGSQQVYGWNKRNLNLTDCHSAFHKCIGPWRNLPTLLRYCLKQHILFFLPKAIAFFVA